MKGDLKDGVIIDLYHIITLTYRARWTHLQARRCWVCYVCWEGYSEPDGGLDLRERASHMICIDRKHTVTSKSAEQDTFI